MKKKISVSVRCNKCGNKLDVAKVDWNWENAVQYQFFCRNCHYNIDITITGKVKKEK
ncbi:hypothetical protein LCGC14_1178160 [marine sediment metagenome]|uniref:Uncharacterized protein n=1 Tax=marine sediment metagenome TaxID=412755 RepID=A0A0F9PTE6_9ZZZZ